MAKKEDSLFRLIKSLNRSEKGYFKKSASLYGSTEKSGYIKLFDAIVGLKEYDEALLRKKLSGASFLVHLASAKNYLFHLILKALKAYHASISIESQVQEILRSVDILIKKQFYLEAGKLLDTALHLAKDQFNNLLMLEILYRQRRLFYYSGSPDEIDRFMEKFPEKARNYLQIEEDNIRCIMLKAKVATEEMRKGIYTNPEKIKNSFEKEARELEQRDLSFQAKLQLYSALIQYYGLTGDFASSYEYSLKNVKQLESDEEYIRQWPVLYVAALHNLMLSSLHVRKYNEFWDVSRKLKKVPVKYRTVLEEDIEKEIFLSYGLELDLYLLTGQFKKGINSVSQNNIESRIKRFEKNTPLDHKVVLYFNISAIYFGGGDFKNSLKWLNFLLNDSSLKGVRTDIHRIARILNLMLQVELNNIDVLEYRVKSAQRYFSKHQEIFRYESIILSFFNRFQKMDTPVLRSQWFLKLKNELAPLLENSAEKEMLKESMVIPWIESKIMEKTMEEIVKKNV